MVSDRQGMRPRECGTRSVLADQRDRIPAVTRIDGSARLHTVRRADHPRYWNLLDRFELHSQYICSARPSSVQEPVACTPEQAPAACLNSGVDALVIGNYVIERNPVGMERRSLQLFLRCILIFSCYPDALRKASC